MTICKNTRSNRTRTPFKPYNAEEEPPKWSKKEKSRRKGSKSKIKSVIKSKITKIKSPKTKKTSRMSIPLGIKARIATGAFRCPLEEQGDWCCTSSMCGNVINGAHEYDHMLPLQYGGKDCCSNLQLLCDDCHKFKTLNIDWRIKKQNLKTREEIFNLQRKVYNEFMC